MNYLINPLLEIHEYNEILSALKNYIMPVNIGGPSDSQKAHISWAICKHLGLKGMFVAFNEMQARKIYEDFIFFAGEEVVFLPTKEIMMHDVEAKSYDAVFQRVKAIDRIVEGKYKFIITSAEASIHKLIPKKMFESNIISFSIGGRINLSELSKKLISMGYERLSVVEGSGQFAIRGGIIDIFSVDSDNAVRIELFDDEIDSIRRFDIMSQRSTEKLESIKILPAGEIIYPIEKRDDIIGKIQKSLDEYIKKVGSKNGPDYIKHVKSAITGDIERIRNEYYFPGMDRYIPFVMETPSGIMDYIDNNTVVFIDEHKRFEQRIENVFMEHVEICKSLMEKGRILPQNTETFFDNNELRERFGNKKLVYLNTIPTGENGYMKSRNFNIISKAASSYQSHIELLVEDIRHWKEKRNRVIVLAGPKGRGERLSETLHTNNIESIYKQDFETDLLPGQVVVTHGILNRGFEYPSIGLVVVSDKEIFGQERRIKKIKSKKEGNKIKAFTDLNVGDYVVHQGHGIGQYVGIQKLVIDNIKRDYLKIRYQDGAFLYIPTNQLDLIQKYIGSEGKAPKINKLGGTDWSKAKARVKESLKELAGELVKLYAKRQATKGFVYSKDTVWQKQFEELFPYDETDDQLKCIDDIKLDMESDRLMDRLLCGDVGYGKTEVAIRAVFKAVMDGKQVAYLVPTTILAQQQYNNFKERMKDFPVGVDVISRFRTQADQKRILKDVKAGNIDVLIGTHRLIQKDIHFKDLGLLVIDEEQRFGVSHKEKIKNLKPNVDVLTLTATPIPRTLHMSLVGIRDISTIEDPPEERYPVQTYVMEYETDVIRDAITRELARGGQIFYLYNRVRTIQIKAVEIKTLVPDANIAVAHGQMDEKELEDIMYRFISGEYNVLVCTTIIESGLDMPNVNTIIVEEADKMGLAQLYQLRGRVGRSNRLAYAYVTYKRDKVLSEVAEKRLLAIKEFTEFGSGFKIAMRDLEIRGAGNLLGPEQHGHMESVGYDMYCRLLDEAVREIKGDAVSGEDEEISIDINVSAYIDDTYINSETQKIDMYKKIAAIQDEADIMDVEDELIDRYGDMPTPVKNLIRIIYLKIMAKACGFTAVQEKNDTLILQFRTGAALSLENLSKLMEKYKRKLLFTASSTPYITFRTTGLTCENILGNIKILLQDIKKLQCS
jgi:transcription-repair coupling factor (superfamily II helicase)